MSTVPEGWYPDPGGKPDTLRRWDGSAWTDEYESVAAHAASEEARKTGGGGDAGWSAGSGSGQPAGAAGWEQPSADDDLDPVAGQPVAGQQAWTADAATGPGNTRHDVEPDRVVGPSSNGSGPQPGIGNGSGLDQGSTRAAASDQLAWGQTDWDQVNTQPDAGQQPAQHADSQDWGTQDWGGQDSGTHDQGGTDWAGPTQRDDPPDSPWGQQGGADQQIGWGQTDWDQVNTQPDAGQQPTHDGDQDARMSPDQSTSGVADQQVGWGQTDWNQVDQPDGANRGQQPEAWNVQNDWAGGQSWGQAQPADSPAVPSNTDAGWNQQNEWGQQGDWGQQAAGDQSWGPPDQGSGHADQGWNHADQGWNQGDQADQGWGEPGPQDPQRSSDWGGHTDWLQGPAPAGQGDEAAGDSWGPAMAGTSNFASPRVSSWEQPDASWDNPVDHSVIGADWADFDPSAAAEEDAAASGTEGAAADRVDETQAWFADEPDALDDMPGWPAEADQAAITSSADPDSWNFEIDRGRPVRKRPRREAAANAAAAGAGLATPAGPDRGTELPGWSGGPAAPPQDTGSGAPPNRGFGWTTNTGPSGGPAPMLGGPRSTGTLVRPPAAEPSGGFPKLAMMIAAGAVVLLLISGVLFFMLRGDEQPRADPGSTPTASPITSNPPLAPTPSGQPTRTPTNRGHNGPGRFGCGLVSTIRQPSPWSDRLQSVKSVPEACGQLVTLQRDLPLPGQQPIDWWAVYLMGDVAPNYHRGTPQQTVGVIYQAIMGDLYANIKVAPKAISSTRAVKNRHAGWIGKWQVTTSSVPGLIYPTSTITVAVFQIDAKTSVTYISSIPTNRRDLTANATRAYQGLIVG